MHGRCRTADCRFKGSRRPSSDKVVNDIPGHIRPSVITPRCSDRQLSMVDAKEIQNCCVRSEQDESVAGMSLLRNRSPRHCADMRQRRACILELWRLYRQHRLPRNERRQASDFPGARRTLGKPAADQQAVRRRDGDLSLAKTSTSHWPHPVTALHSHAALAWSLL